MLFPKMHVKSCKMMEMADMGDEIRLQDVASFVPHEWIDQH